MSASGCLRCGGPLFGRTCLSASCWNGPDSVRRAVTLDAIEAAHEVVLAALTGEIPLDDTAKSALICRAVAEYVSVCMEASVRVGKMDPDKVRRYRRAPRRERVKWKMPEPRAVSAGIYALLSERQRRKYTLATA